MTQADIALQALGPQAPESAASATQADRALAAMNAPVTASGRSWADQIGDFLQAAGHHAMNLPHGMAQLVENATSGVANAVAPNAGFTRRLTDVVDADNRAMSDREAAYQKGVPNSAGAYAGATLGEVAPLVVGGIPRGLQQAGDYVASKVVPKALADAAPIVPRIASGATQGSIVGAAQPVAQSPTLSDLVNGQTPSYWSQKGSQVGVGAATMGAVPFLGAGVGAVKNAVAPIFSPQSIVSPLVQKLTGGDQALIDALRNPQQLVPGSVPTTAQILATPEAVAVEKALANASPAFKNQLASRSNENNAARIAAVQGVAQTPQALAEAVQARSDATRPLIDSLLTKGKPVDATPVLEQLRSLQASSLGTDPVVKRAATDLLSSIEEGVANTGQGGNLVRPDLLDGYRQNVRSFLQQHASNGAVGTKQEAAFEPVRSAIVDSIEGANPGYRDYLATYAQKSQPINTMEAAGSLLDNVAGAGRSANSSGDPQVALRGYSTALAKALKGDYGIAPEAQSTLEAVQRDLQRESISSSLRSPGSDTAYNLQAPGWLGKQLYGSDFTGNTTAAKALGAALGSAGGYLTGSGGYGMATGAATGAAAGNYLAQLGRTRVNDVLAKALSDPEFAAKLAAQTQAPQTIPRIPQLAYLLSQ